jgi:hypothetical protein
MDVSQDESGKRAVRRRAPKPMVVLPPIALPLTPERRARAVNALSNLLADYMAKNPDKFSDEV